MKKLHALVIGASGATGKELLKLLLEDSNYYKVSIYVRRKIDISHKKLTIHKINFNKINEYTNIIKGDILFSALGTTKKEAGGKKAQFLVDYIYQYEFAKIACKNGVYHYSLVSSIGADKNSFFFYPKIKGELEEAVKHLNFKYIHIFQPPSIIRQSDLIRPGEKYMVRLLQTINKLGFLQVLKPISVIDLAVKIFNESLLNEKEGITIYTPNDLFK